jgi:anti-sigma factor RsiW
MAEQSDRPDGARDLLAWYVNHSLDEDERARVERYLAQSERGRAEAVWLAQLKRDIDATIEIPPGDLGRARLMARLAAERESLGKIVDLPQRSARPRWIMPALALAATVVLAQAFVIGLLVHERGGYQTLSGPTATSGDQLQVTFNPAATERDIRALLTSVEAEIISGPGALGVYTVRVTGGRGDDAVKRLGERKELVQSVSIIRR